jgi:hypothetical protein
MKPWATFWTRPGWLAIPGLLYLFSQPVLAGLEVFRAGPPVEIQRMQPPAEIQRVRPPTEVQQVKPPEEIQRVRPPGEVQRVKPPEVRRGVPVQEVRQAPTQVHLRPPRPDLQVRTIGLSSTSPKVGERVVITALVRNSGDESARRVKVSFFAGDQQIGDEKIVSLAPGATETVTEAFVPKTAGRQQVRVQVVRGDAATGEAGQADQARIITVTAPIAPSGRETGGLELASQPDYRGSLKKPQTKADSTPPHKMPTGEGKGKGKDQQDAGAGADSEIGFPPDVIGDAGKGPGKSGWKGDGLDTGSAGEDDMPSWFGGDRGLPSGFQRPDPSQSQVDLGATGGIHPRFFPGGAYKGGKKINPWDSADRWIGGLRKDKTVTSIEAWTVDSQDGVKTVWVDATTEDGMHFVGWVNDKGEGSGRWLAPDEYKLVMKEGRRGPEPEGVSTGASPKEKLTEPRLVMKWLKTAPRDKFRPDESVTDPMPVKPKEGVAAGVLADRLAQAAGGPVKAEAKWMFIGRKPGGGVTDPPGHVPEGGRRWGDSGVAPIQRFEVVDPPEAVAIGKALAQAQTHADQGSSGKSAAVASVAGSVQKLTEQGGQQGWVPLKAGESLGQGSIIRVESNTGGEVGVGNVNTALSMRWSQIHSGPNHVLYQLQTMK